MTMGLEPKWTDLSDMLATCTDDQLLKWKEVAENPMGDNFNFITSLRQLVVHMYNKRSRDIINELSIAVNDELNFRNRGIDTDNKLENRISRLEKLLNNSKSTKNESMLTNDLSKAIRGLSMADKVLVELVNEYYGTDNPMRTRWSAMANQVEDMIDELMEMSK